MSEKGQPLPKFGEWDVNDPASAEGFTVIFNKARDEKKTGGKPESPGKVASNVNHGVDTVKPQAVSQSLLYHQLSTTMYSGVHATIFYLTKEKMVLLHSSAAYRILTRFST